jgi:hypothetical protein
MLLPNSTPCGDLPPIAEIKPFGPKDVPLLIDLAAVLFKHGALDRVGVFLAYQCLEIENGEIIAETFPATGMPGLIHALPLSQSERAIETHIMLSPEGEPRLIRICLPGLV